MLLLLSLSVVSQCITEEKLTIKIPALVPKKDNENYEEPQISASTLQSLTDIIQVQKDQEGINLKEILKNRYSEDSFFKLILDNPRQYKNFELDNGLVFMKRNNEKLLCIPHILHEGRNVREIVISEAHSLLAHLGARKTIDYLRPVGGSYSHKSGGLYTR